MAEAAAKAVQAQAEIYLLTLHARTDVPLSSARTWTPVSPPPKIKQT